ncbi:MAG: ATP-binding protein [Clostridia bacterium]|nr:ATP-binding protein [Clostridia bacterium]
MLVEFSVKNFMSIKDEMTFSMVAGTGDENIENIIKDEKTGEGYLKSTAIYGANASGKTNFMRALTAAILTVRRSNLRNINEPLIEMKPFKFDSKTVNEPCEFKFVFIKNNIKYIYGFSADVNRIYTEYLYQYLSAKPSLIFERKNINEYKFTQSEQSKLEELATKNTEKKLFLSTATAWNYEKTKDAYIWFSEDIDTYNDYMNVGGYAFDKFEKDEEGSLKKFTINLLKQADILIKDYNFEVKDMNLNNIIAFNNVKIPNENIVQKEVRISTLHEIENENGDKENYELELQEESLGTQSLFFFSPILKEAFEKGKVIIVDEIDKSLHPLLVEFIIKLFHNSEINKNNAQLIFNTHDTNLLSLDNFRRDQIWFTEKEPKKGTTELYPLDDFSVRKTENVQKGYLNGRYGAIPFLATGNSLWED